MRDEEKRTHLPLTSIAKHELATRAKREVKAQKSLKSEGREGH